MRRRRGGDDFSPDLGIGSEVVEEKEPAKMKAEDEGDDEYVDLDFELGFDLDDDEEENEGDEEERVSASYLFSLECDMNQFSFILILNGEL